MTDGYSRSKNASRVREKRKYTEYRRREYERRKLQRREERARTKKEELVRVPNCSILSETTREVCNRTQTDLKQYFVRKKIEKNTSDYFHSPAHR